MPPKKVICILTKEIYSRMRRFDYSTMPLEQAVAWDPTSIAGQAITNEKWKNVTKVNRVRRKTKGEACYLPVPENKREACYLPVPENKTEGCYLPVP